MLILLALIFAASAGMTLHYVLPHREMRGVALAALLATSVAAILYAGLTWLGLAESNPWLWVASLLGPVVITWVAIVVLTRTRLAHDVRERERLRIPAAP